MFDDAPLPTKKPAPPVLDHLSIEELTNYIDELEAEINRVRIAMRDKKAHGEAAAAMFRKQFE